MTIFAYFDGSPKSNHLCCVFEGEINEEPEIVNLAGSHTNNEMEYQAMLYTMQRLMNKNMQTVDIILKGDSELVINQMIGKDKVAAPNLIVLHQQAKQAERELLRYFKSITFEWIPREVNLAGMAIEKKQKEQRKQLKFGEFSSNSPTPTIQHILNHIEHLQSELDILRDMVTRFKVL